MMTRIPATGFTKNPREFAGISGGVRARRRRVPGMPPPDAGGRRSWASGDAAARRRGLPEPGVRGCGSQAPDAAAAGRQGVPQLLFWQIRRAVASKKTLPAWVGSVTGYAAPPPAAAICCSAGKLPLLPSMMMISSTGRFGL
jgi:hypothetical protein